MEEPAVSIVTPAYEAAAFVAEAVASVRAQTRADWEMIVVDDCSRDDTREVVSRAAAGDRRVRLIRHEKNCGPAASRNTALAAASGRFVAFLDADDVWMPRKLERQLQFMAERDSALSFTSYRRIRQGGTACGRLIAIPRRLAYRDLLKNTAITTSTVVVDRRRTGTFSMRDTYYDDFVLWLDILKRGFTADGLPEDLVRYRMVQRSVSRDKANSARRVWRTYREIEKLGPATSLWCFGHYAWHAFVKYSRF